MAYGRLKDIAQNHVRQALGRSSRLVPTLFILCVGVAGSIGLFFVMRLWEYREDQAEFDYAATHVVEAIRRTTERIELVHEALREYYYGAPNVTRKEFATSVAPFLPHVPSLKSWQWVPRVSLADRDHFEEEARHEGFVGFQITEEDHGSNGKKLTRAGNRSEYFPVWYAVSQTGSPPQLGWDVGSVPVLRAALDKCRDSDAIVTTRRLTLQEYVGRGSVFLTLVPVYRQPQLVFTVEDRRRNLEGFLVGICMAGELVEDALSYDIGSRGIDVQLIDQSAPAGHTFLYFHTSRAHPKDTQLKVAPPMPQPSDIQYTDSLIFGKRHWAMVCTPSPNFFAADTKWRSWVALGVGLLLTFFAVSFASSAATRQERVERLVGERTLELRKKDDQLRLSQEMRAKAIRMAHEETIQRLVTASLCRDEETGMHIKRTGLLSEALARAAGWSEADAETIRLAAPMHDVGKIGIPDAILRKPGKFTPDEFEVMKTHTLIGAKMLEGSQSAILAMARDIALCHHEYWDGGGYPQGLSGTAIPEAARILSIVDVYDALSHDRVYRPALDEDRVVEYLVQRSGIQFDPMLLAVFLAHYEEMHSIAMENPDESGTFDISDVLSSASASANVKKTEEPEASPAPVFAEVETDNTLTPWTVY
jgi:HD-GYP domain-containing protein (c-di-GMP phosphodiesterase class II)